MRKRLVRTVIFIAVALGVAVGAAGAAGALGSFGTDGLKGGAVTEGSMWD